MTVIIGIDPHKRSHTAVALDEHNEQLDELRVVADRGQVDRLLAWAGRWPERLWAIENANGLGWLLSPHPKSRRAWVRGTTRVRLAVRLPSHSWREVRWQGVGEPSRRMGRRETQRGPGACGG